MHNLRLIILSLTLCLSLLITCVDSGYDGNLDFGYRVVCYYSAVGSWYRRGRAMYLPSDVDTHLCTHIIYKYAILDPTTLTAGSSDEWADIDNGLYKRVTELKSENPSLKVMLSLGGCEESSEKYSKLVSSSKYRKAFVEGIVMFLKYHSFDGLDFAWFYPSCWNYGKDCGNSHKDDKRNTVLLIRELREAFDKQETRLELSMAVSADRRIIPKAYDIRALSRYVDFFNIMTFDFNTRKSGKTGHHSAFYYRTGDVNRLENVNSTMHYWVAKGAPKRKLIMGVPTFGRSLTLSNSSLNGIKCPTNGKGRAGEITRSDGTLAYYEICDRIYNFGWNKKVDKYSGPYAYFGNQWVSYDDPEIVDRKGRYVKSNGFGGLMIWDIDRDDFRGSCFGIKSSITRAAHISLLHG